MAHSLPNPQERENVVPLRVVGADDVPYRDRADEDLMLAHGEGDERAYAELVRRYQKPILNYTYRLVQNRQVAEELTQEVFLALVRNAGRYQPTAKFTTYLFTIASNIVSKEWLRQKRRPRLLSLSRWTGRYRDEEGFNPMDQVGDEKADTLEKYQHGEIKAAVHAALEELPEHQREAFALRRFQDLSYDEIAEILDAPVGTVKSRVVRAERALRPLLERYREYVQG